MAKVHEVAIGADGRAFDQGIRSGVIKPTEDAVKALGKLEDAASDAGRDGSRDLDRLEDSLKDVQRQSETTERSMDDIGTGGSKGFGRVRQASADFKQEALANFSEVTSSFDGSMGSIQDLAQGTLGGIASSDIPGVSIAAGIAAIAVGTIGAAIADAGKEKALDEEAVADWADAYIKAGGTIIGTAQVIAGVQSIVTDPERYKEAAQNAEDWGVSEATAMRAMAGDANALLTVRETLNARTEEANRLLAEQEEQTTANAGAVYDLADSAERGAESFGVLNGEMEGGRERAALLSESLLQIVQDAGSASEEVDEFGNRLLTLPGGAQVMIDADTGQATDDVSRFKGDVDGVPEIIETTVKVGVDSSAWDNWSPKQKRALIGYSAIAADKQSMRLVE